MFAFDVIAPLAGRITHAIGAATDDEAGAFRRAHAPLVEMLPPVVEDKPLVADESANSFRASIGVGTAPLVLLVASRDEPRKGLDFALAAFTLLRQRLPEVRLALIGFASTSRTLPDGVLMLGRVDDATLARANRAADVVFVPSLFEAFSRVVIEAWQQSTPVVVSDGVALAPVVRRLGGAVVAYGDAQAAASELENTLREPDRAKRQGLAGQQLVRREYVVDVLVDRVVTVYRTILAQRRLDTRRR
jgi:glycosyltransferase involved in cell wall biosynthesis